MADTAAAPRTKRLSGRDRRAQILVAARRVFTQSGFAGGRIKAISEEAGVNEALLYRHFDSKEALFEAAIVEPLEESVDRVLALGRQAEQSAGSPASFRELVGRLIEEMLTGVMEIAPLLGVVLFGDEQRGAAFYRERFAPGLDRLVAGLTYYQRSHGEQDRYDARLLVELSVGATLLLSLDQRFGRRAGESPAVVAQQLADHLLLITAAPRTANR